jgi:hypothetical protein
MPTLDDVSFDSASLQYIGDRDGCRVWLTPTQDPVSLYLFAIPPDIAADTSQLAALRAFYRSHHASVGAVLISLETIRIDTCLVVSLITKIPQQPSGMTYIGSVTIPFRDCSFVVKAEAREHGTTGIRDTLVADEMMQAGVVSIDVEAGLIRGWTKDPYDSTLCDGPYPNLSEAEAYDARFPSHPLSRVRSLLKQITQSLQLSRQLRTLPPFVYPPVKRNHPWWRFK